MEVVINLTLLTDEELNHLNMSVTKGRGGINGPVMERLAMLTSAEWRHRHPGQLPPWLADRELPPCFSMRED